MIALLILVVLGVLVLGILAWVAGSYNGLVRLRNQVENAWAQIDVQLKRRCDLIPNLVETVKGYAKQEQNVLVEVTNAECWLGIPPELNHNVPSFANCR